MSLLTQSSRERVWEPMVPAPLLEGSEAPSASDVETLQKGFLFRSSPLPEVMASALVQVQATAISYHSPPGADSSLLPAFSQRDLMWDKSHHITPCSAVSYRHWMNSTLGPFPPRSPRPLLYMLQTQAGCAQLSLP